MRTVRPYLNKIVLQLSKLLGTTICDHRSGQPLGKAFIFAYGGRIHLIGYKGPDLILEFEPQARLTYWKQSIRFSIHQGPFPGDSPSSKESSRATPLWPKS